MGNADDLTIRGLDLKGSADLKSIQLSKVAVGNVEAGPVKHLELQESGINRLALSDVDAQNLSMTNITAGDVTLEKAGISNLDVSHVSTDDMKVHGLDLKG